MRKREEERLKIPDRIGVFMTTIKLTEERKRDKVKYGSPRNVFSSCFCYIRFDTHSLYQSGSLSKSRRIRVFCKQELFRVVRLGFVR